MGYKLVVKPEAERDLLDALAWYEEQKSGLDADLYIEISNLLDDITLHPEHFQERYRNVRIRFTRKFKYGVHYTIERKTVNVHAIFHTSRMPRK